MAFPVYGKRKTTNESNRLVFSNNFNNKDLGEKNDSSGMTKTIYLDNRVSNGWICRYCEGINRKQTLICHICGCESNA